MSWRRGGYTYTPYINSLELEDGSVLTIHFTTKRAGGGYSNHPEDEDSETTFILNGEPVDREELPSEVTAEIIKELEDDAREDTGFDTGEGDF